jgi:hypothetical protein
MKTNYRRKVPVRFPIVPAGATPKPKNIYNRNKERRKNKKMNSFSIEELMSDSHEEFMEEA